MLKFEWRNIPFEMQTEFTAGLYFKNLFWIKSLLTDLNSYVTRIVINRNLSSWILLSFFKLFIGKKVLILRLYNHGM